MKKGTPIKIRSTGRLAVLEDYRLCPNGQKVAVVSYGRDSDNKALLHQVPPQDVIAVEWTPAEAATAPFAATSTVFHRLTGEVGIVRSLPAEGGKSQRVEFADGEVIPVDFSDLQQYDPSSAEIDPSITFWSDDLGQKASG